MADKLARANLARAAVRFHADSGAKSLPALILMTDDARLPDPIAAAYALPRGSMVILRVQDDARRAALAQALRPLARARGLKFLVANDAALAARIAADGVHFSEARAKDAAHWRALRPSWIITAAAHSLRACMALRFADAILLSPVFATQSHPRADTHGAVKFRAIARQVVLPVYALGGIDAAAARRLHGAKLAGIAAIGGLSV